VEPLVSWRAGDKPTGWVRLFFPNLAEPITSPAQLTARLRHGAGVAGKLTSMLLN
jgi:uncharacterized protein (DUF1810 family)